VPPGAKDFLISTIRQRRSPEKHNDALKPAAGLKAALSHINVAHG
jgi:hypothetical protein